MSRSFLLAFVLVFSALFLMPVSALAHVGVSHGSGFVSGFTHPLLGLDHLLAMLAVGLWAAQMGGRRTWIVPAVFVAVMGVGGGVGMLGWNVPFVEQGIVASVLVLGVLIAAAYKSPLGVGAALVAVFAFFHGHAHGTEMPFGAVSAAYSGGFVLATALLHATGIAVGVGLQKVTLGRVARFAGGTIAAMGADLIFAM